MLNFKFRFFATLSPVTTTLVTPVNIRRNDTILAPHMFCTFKTLKNDEHEWRMVNDDHKWKCYKPLFARFDNRDVSPDFVSTIPGRALWRWLGGASRFCGRRNFRNNFLLNLFCCRPRTLTRKRLQFGRLRFNIGGRTVFRVRR